MLIVITWIVLFDSSVEAAVKVFLNARNHSSGFHIRPARFSKGICFCLSVIIHVLRCSGMEKTLP